MVPVVTTGVEEDAVVEGILVAGLAVESEQGTNTKTRGKSKRGHPIKRKNLKLPAHLEF